jgi:broad specificity phosphatase PhoE
MASRLPAVFKHSGQLPAGADVVTRAARLGRIDEGFAQAQALAQHLPTHWQPIRLLSSSDSRRAAETTDEILQALPVPMRYVPKWREMKNGELAGMRKGLADDRYLSLSLHTYPWTSHGPTEKALGSFLSAFSMP